MIREEMKKKSDSGIALIVVMIFLVLLTSLGLWLNMTSVMEMRTTAALKNYEKAFDLADGATQLDLRYLYKTTPPSPSWNPSVEGAITSGLPEYLQEQTVGKGKIKPKIIYKGYLSTPPPGWMLNWQGYSGFHRLQYVARGQGEIPQVGSKSTVDIILTKISQ